jgi:hypothetical protein
MFRWNAQGERHVYERSPEGLSNLRTAEGRS